MPSSEEGKSIGNRGIPTEITAWRTVARGRTPRVWTSCSLAEVSSDGGRRGFSSQRKTPDSEDHSPTPFQTNIHATAIPLHTLSHPPAPPQPSPATHTSPPQNFHPAIANAATAVAATSLLGSSPRTGVKSALKLPPLLVIVSVSFAGLVLRWISCASGKRTCSCSM